MSRSHGAVAATGVIGVIALACGTPYIATTEYQRHQMAYVPAPGGPHAIGPVLAADQTSIEASAQMTSSRAGTGSRDDGAIGHVTPQLWTRLRLAHGMLDRFELGMELEVAPGNLSTSSTIDVAGVSTRAPWLVRGGFQFRAIAIGSRRFGLGLDAEAGIGSTPYNSVIVEMSSFSTGGGSSDTRASDTVLVVPSMRTGPFLHAMPAPWIALLGGFLVQTTPRFDGLQTYGSVCRSSGGLFYTSCTYSPTTWPAQYTLIPIGTLWASASFLIGPVTLTAQFFGNVIGDAQIVANAPYGGDLAVRLAF